METILNVKNLMCKNKYEKFLKNKHIENILSFNKNGKFKIKILGVKTFHRLILILYRDNIVFKYTDFDIYNTKN